MRMKGSILLIVLLVVSLGVFANSSISGTLYNQYGKVISDAEIFINGTHVFRPNSDGIFSVQIKEDIQNITIRSFEFYSHKIKANFSQQNLDLGKIHLIPRLLWTDKSIKLYYENSTDYSKFSHKRFEEEGRNKKPRYRRWIIDGRSKFYNTEGKLVSTLKFKKGVLIMYRRKNGKKWSEHIVEMNEKHEVILDLTS